MAQALVSVIIPVYNMESFLSDTLDSVLASVYPCIEVIIMDDGSTDSSFAIAQQYACKDIRIKAYTQPNQGVSAARNHAINKATGTFILPVDADNLIEKDFIGQAVSILLTDKQVKAVVPRAAFFGARTGEWKLPPFSLSLLARKNIIDTCALYRKEDWERVGGYCEEIVAREDWEFWISVLKDGGKVIRTSEVMLHYRVRETSKRKTDRMLKHHVINVLNKRHPEFFERELNGKLHYWRSWSRIINRFYRLIHPRKVMIHQDYDYLTTAVKTLPVLFSTRQGQVIHEGRNELRQLKMHGCNVVVKSFAIPNLINRIVYGTFRSSKAQRSFENALKLLDKGIGTPFPIGYYTERNGLLFAHSYYVSMQSECLHTYADLFEGKAVAEESVLKAIARTTALLHEAGFLHKDYSRGNILFSVDKASDTVKVEIVDLNRIRFQSIDMECGCKNFERLPGPKEWFRIMAKEYASVRGFDAEECYRLIMKYNRGH